ncbi:pyridoxal phosphate-dependent decarboxylase family protein [Streptomyces sp. CB02261]|uniref:pyridoxal phosphate-dependent decarboxylase family protein n=1 Tax=Streptomyces sp. CB02261 TaxID=1703940 RepID=UPI00095CF522|nr:pyridoxal-dependent decarboxylase [Streptomyces sp. CB02261]OKJ52622.1 pyridoxal-dependent decarboxylase [Streptomyces sp. CB02261]
MPLLSEMDRNGAIALLNQIVTVGVDFKLDDQVTRKRLAPAEIRDLLVTDLPVEPTCVPAVVQELVDTVLPMCNNEASPRFLGFGHTGADVAALAGGLLALFAQQNLINQSFAAPSATFTEIAVIRWLRDLIGFTNPAAADVKTVWDVGGVTTYGGTGSNTTAMMLARENLAPGTMHNGVTDATRMHIVVPAGIGHYSVKSALEWIGCGGRIIEVPTSGYRYDLTALEHTLKERRGEVMSVVAYTGDSRTHTVENLRAVHDITRAIDPRIWLHADACWGLMCAFAPELAHKLTGIENFDSVTVDPHKVMDIPYAMSALLVRDPASLRLVSSYSDLIMQEDFAFGQVTPFIGTKEWSSVKLWAMMRAHGRRGLADLMRRRLITTRTFTGLVDDNSRLLRLNDPDMTAVVFMYLPTGHDPLRPDVERINAISKAIHARILEEGRWHFHQFSLPDDTGRIQQDATLHPLRFMGNNGRITESHMRDALAYVTGLGHALEQQ